MNTWHAKMSTPWSRSYPPRCCKFDNEVLTGHSNSTGAFIDRRGLYPLWIVLGARADINKLRGNNQDRSFTTNSLSASLAWALSEKTQTNITLGNAFRHPTLRNFISLAIRPEGELGQP